MKGSEVEYIILNLYGQVIRQVFLPQPPPVLFDDQLSGRINLYYSFYGDFYYYLWENSDTENWELHAVNWKEKQGILSYRKTILVENCLFRRQYREKSLKM